jgi:hypothetical protein
MQDQTKIRNISSCLDGACEYMGFDGLLRAHIRRVDDHGSFGTYRAAKTLAHFTREGGFALKPAAA